MGEKKRVRAVYPEEFDRFWRAYNPPPSASKKSGYASYKTLIKDMILPDHPLLLCCVEAYNEFIASESKPGKPHPKCHPATWLNQHRFEGFMERAEALLARQQSKADAKEAAIAVTSPTWPDSVLKALRVSDAILTAWFLPCTLNISDERAEIIAPTQMHVNWLRNKYPSHIERALGPDVIIRLP